MVGAVIAVLCGITVLMLWERNFVESISFAEQEVRELHTIHSEQLELFVAQSNLLTTLASALLAALGAVALNAAGPRLNHGALVLLGASAIFSGCSLYF